jgi:hypothetical protein
MNDNEGVVMIGWIFEEYGYGWRADKIDNSR